MNYEVMSYRNYELWLTAGPYQIEIFCFEIIFNKHYASFRMTGKPCFFAHD